MSLPTEGVCHLSRFQGCLFPHTNTGTVQKISKISYQGQVIPVQSPPIQTVHSTLGVYSGCQRSEAYGFTQGYKDPPVPRRLVGESQIPPNLSQAHLVQLCQNLGWLVNLEKSELDPIQVFDFIGYQFDLQRGRVRPTQERWQTLQQKLRNLLACPVWQFMFPIGLLTATEKQDYLGMLHMRPIQWHLKNKSRVPESLEKVIPIPRSLHLIYIGGWRKTLT